MKRQLLGVILATLAVYMWGFLYWGASPLPYSSWKQTGGDEAARQALLEHFPESGTYYVPGVHHDEETRARLSEAGPVAFVHINREGRPVVDPSIMINGFLLTLVVILLFSVLLKQASVDSYAGRVKFVALLGLAAVVMIDFGDAVWWQIPWTWKIHQAFYNFGAWVIAGLVLAKFVSSEPRRSEGRHS